MLVSVLAGPFYDGMRRQIQEIVTKGHFKRAVVIASRATRQGAVRFVNGNALECRNPLSNGLSDADIKPKQAGCL